MLSFALLCLQSTQQPAAAGAIPLDSARRACAELEAAAMADGGKLWGVELIGPVLFVDPATHDAVANQPDEQSKLAEKDGVFVGTLPAEIGVANTATDWAGVRWTMVMWPLPDNHYARARLLLHECFHRIQPQLNHGGGDALNLQLDTQQGRYWLRLEFRALAEALIRARELRQRSIEDALLFRARRRELFPDAGTNESAFERNEGLAEYTGLRLCGYPEWVLADRAAQKLEKDESAASFVRSFAYATGPAYGVLLDERSPEWRRAIDPKTDLAALLARALSWKAPGDLAAEADKRAARYDGVEVLADEQRRAAERSATDARNRALFVDGPLLVLPFVKMGYTFDFNAITPLGDAGSVYRTVQVSDEWGILDVKDGALITRSANGGMVDVRVPAPKDAAARPIAGEGWTLALKEGWTLVPGARAGDWKVVRAQ